MWAPSIRLRFCLCFRHRIWFYQILNCKKAVGETINLGTGYEISIKDLIKVVSKILKKILQ